MVFNRFKGLRIASRHVGPTGIRVNMKYYRTDEMMAYYRGQKLWVNITPVHVIVYAMIDVNGNLTDVAKKGVAIIPLYEFMRKDLKDEND